MSDWKEYRKNRGKQLREQPPANPIPDPVAEMAIRSARKVRLDRARRPISDRDVDTLTQNSIRRITHAPNDPYALRDSFTTHHLINDSERSEETLRRPAEIPENAVRSGRDSDQHVSRQKKVRLKDLEEGGVFFVLLLIAFLWLLASVWWGWEL